MATPLYKDMKSKGTSFYAFPSAASDYNKSKQNDNYKMNFTKFVLLDIPEQSVVISTGIERDQEKGVMNFDKNIAGPRFFNFQPGENSDLPTTFAEQLVESLRNYVANYDASLRESRVNSNTDFFNVNEKITPTDSIFWKWAKKLNLIDLEPALHKVDWDKNLTDFLNNNGTSNDFFKKYLWKERDINYYNATLKQGTGNHPLITISQNAKFKTTDTIMLSGDTGSLSAATSYDILTVTYTGGTTEISLDIDNYTDSTTYNLIIYLNYNPFIQYIGEIQAVSKIQTSRRDFTEVTAQIPHHQGKTPTVLFEIFDNNNYYPSLEMPILAIEQQEEIVGSENTNSPIRLEPQNYPGTYYGYFDTADKTYKCSTGDRLRYSGDYYGISLTNNVGLEDENYFEKLTDFNSDNIDGLKLDFDRDHYLKMNLPDQEINNFDEFNAAYLDGYPEDFQFNAILWYYELDDGSGQIVTNLFGIEFLNNPGDDFDDCDINDRKITPYRKLVSNGNQDGLSYIFNLNLNWDIDNDVLPLSYDPTSVYNQFGFDLYQNILQTNAKLQDNFVTIISGFTSIQDELFDLRSIIYSQTDIDTIKSQIENLNDLLTLYSTFQFQDSDTAKIETDFTGSYPTLKVNVVNTKYSSILDINISDVYDFNDTNSGASYSINIPFSNQLLANIYNDNNDVDGIAKVVLSKDLAYKQAIDIYIYPNLSTQPNLLDINIMYNNGLGSITQQTLISGYTSLPIDLSYYNVLNPTGSTYNNSYYINDNIYTYSKDVTTGYTYTTINVMDDLFEDEDYIYINNFYLQSGTTITDFSGVYLISGHTSGVTTGSYDIVLDSYNYVLVSKPKISYYKGVKINILRVSSSNTSSLNDRYQITKQLL